MTWNSRRGADQGLHRTEILGGHFSIFYTHGTRQGPPQAMLEGAARGSAEGGLARAQRRSASGRTLVHVRDDGGNLLGFGKVTRDLTDAAARTRSSSSSRRRPPTTSRSRCARSAASPTCCYVATAGELDSEAQEFLEHISVRDGAGCSD